MQIRELLSMKSRDEVYSIAPDALVSEAVRQLVERNISSLVVLKDGKMVGMLTAREIFKGMHAGGCLLADVQVSELMEKEPLVCGPEDSVEYAQDVLTKSHASHLVAMEDNRILGVISLQDTARACLKQANFENSLLKRYIKNWPE